MKKLISILTLFVLMVPVIWGQDTVTDIDGNVYETVLISEQLWMKENLKVTHYRNGDEIPTGHSDSEWVNLSTGAYRFYYDIESNADTYGYLYNWYAVDDDRGVCPANWHVPTDDEWTILSDYLGGESVAGGKLKECTEGSCPESDYWTYPNTGATNESGFTGLPGGYRGSTGNDSNMGLGGYFWSSTESNSNYAWFRELSYGNSGTGRSGCIKTDGFSVRCIRDPIPQTILVPQDYPTIQAGINASSDGDTVLVSAGTYVENINFNGKNIAVIGEDRETTIIDGNQNGSVVIAQNIEAFISGVTIQNGSIGLIPENQGEYCGGGIYIEGSDFTINNCIIKDNNIDGRGGGISSMWSDCTIKNSLIYNNSSSNYGSAFYAHDGIKTIENTIIINNNGGTNTILLANGSGIISNSVIANNANEGIFLWSVDEFEINNTTIINNETIGVFIRESYGEVHNSIIFNNGSMEVEYSGEFGPSELLISYSDIEGGENGIETNDNGTVPWGEGNIDADPLFVDPDNGDFTLQPSSPCIDAGDPSSPLDPDGTIADMGAYYYDQIENPIIWGCTDSTATNYNPDANVDNGSCCIELWGECNNIENTTELNLSNSGLTGEIPSEIGNLTNLTYLSLHTNQLTGEIPPEIGNLTNLSYLYLYTNQLTGEIPPEIGNLTNLTGLYLNDNQLTEEIPPEIGNLANLTGLDLSNNQLTGEIPVEIGNLTNLTDLRLNNNQLTGEIPSEIGNLTNLTSLDLRANQLTGILPEIGNLINLNSLYLSDNQLTGEIQPEIGNLTNLTTLDLGNNEFTGEIPPEIGTLTNLIHLYLSATQLTGEIPSEIGNLTNLTSLELYYNQLTGSIPPEIGNLTNLEQLRLDNNELTGEIPSEIGNLTNLSWLRLNDNQLSGEIPPEIGNLTNLISVYLHNNQLSGEIPSEIGNLTNLTSLRLYSNQLTGLIPPEICNQGDSSPSLNNNQLCPPYPDCGEGPITSEEDQDTSECPLCNEETEVELWGECYNIETTTSLNLSNSGLTGEIPSEIGNLTNLTDLSLGYNQLTGSIPSEIGNLTNLINLDLSDNQLTGDIPSEIVNLTNLIILFLGNNQLTGSIPSDIIDLVNLTHISLYDNQLSGEIPSEISSLPNLISLYLSNNQLSGEIPVEIGNLIYLEVLYLDINQLSGEIPIQIGQLVSLNNLNFSYNNFNGLIPNNICELTLDELHFTNNQLCPPYPECLSEEDIGYQDTSNCNAVITDILDVPDDQGGWVNVHFEGIVYDDTDPNRTEAYYVQRNDGEYWNNVGSAPAINDSFYVVQAMTLIDSTSGSNNGVTEFRVVASMDEGIWISESDWGYSVDNIAPAVPTNLMAITNPDIVNLFWDAPVDEDFNYFNIYRSEEEGFTPSQENLIGYAIESSYTDTPPEGVQTVYYTVSATDIHGNEGESAEPVSAVLMSTMSVSYANGWNMVGLPFEVDDAQYQNLFPEAYTGALYSYDGSYNVEEELIIGTGYLLRLANGGSVDFIGLTIDTLTLSFTEGWNLISGISTPVDADVLYNSGIIAIGGIYGYDGSYFNADMVLWILPSAIHSQGFQL